MECCEYCLRPGEFELECPGTKIYLCAKHKKKPKLDDPFKNWIFMTLSPSKIKHGSIPMSQMPTLKSWAESWFQEYNYKQFFWAIETGSNAEDPHLHLHALVKDPNIKLKKRGHYNLLKQEWNRVMDIKLETSASWMEKQVKKKLDVDILYQHINDKNLWGLKYNYLNNDLKGTHRNFQDSGVAGAL